MTGGWSVADMARQVAAMLRPGQSVNLGIGLPTQVAEHIPAGLGIAIHAENGILGVGGRPTAAEVSPTCINAGKETIAVLPGASYFDSALSFGMVRGGHLDLCVLGGMQVDAAGSLANWMVPGARITGMGGAMDLVHGAKQLVVMMRHCDRHGRPKLVACCNLPLTGFAVVHAVVTERCVLDIDGGGFVLRRLAPGVLPEALGLPECRWRDGRADAAAEQGTCGEAEAKARG